MRWLAVTLVLLAAVPAFAHPVSITVGPPNSAAKVYGPADMLCDLNNCRLFNLPKSGGMPPDAIVEFGMPKLSGQDRVNLRRCFQVCRASATGYVTKPFSDEHLPNPTVTIIPTELNLE